MAMAMAVIASPTAAMSPLTTRHPWKGALNLSSPRPLELRTPRTRAIAGIALRAGMGRVFPPRQCPRSSSYSGGEVIEAEFTPVVENPVQNPLENPVQEPQQQEIPQEQEASYDDGGYNDETQAQYEMEGGETPEDYDQEYEQQYDEGYDQSQYQQYDQSQYQDQSQQQSYEQSPYSAEKASTEPPPYFDNFGKVMKFIAMGRAMQFKLDSQKDFETFLDKCSAYGVMIPEAPSDIKRNLCELDPKETWIVVDSRAVMKFAKKLALEEAERNKDDYPPGFVENMLNRDKYGRYKSDDDY